MQIRNIVLAASATAITLAAPATPSETFGVVAIHSGSDVQYSAFNAANGSILAGMDMEDATFYIIDGVLYLYDKSTAAAEEIYVDRSGMGQGIIGYTTGILGAPKNSEREGWAVNDNHLQFMGNDLIACPNSIDGAWSIWATAGIANPAGNTDCVGIAARVEYTSNPTGASTQ